MFTERAAAIIIAKVVVRRLQIHRRRIPPEAQSLQDIILLVSQLFVTVAIIIIFIILSITITNITATITRIIVNIII